MSASKARAAASTHPRSTRRRGRRGAALPRARRRHRGPQVPGLGGGQRCHQRRAGPRDLVRLGLLRRRRTHAQAVAAPGTGPGHRIRKRTCHITIIVSRLPDAELRRRQERQAAAAPSGRARRRGGAVADRRSRVARSRQRDRGAATTEETSMPDEPSTPVPGEPTEETLEAAEEAEESTPRGGDDADRPTSDTVRPPPPVRPWKASTRSARPARAGRGRAGRTGRCRRPRPRRRRRPRRRGGPVTHGPEGHPYGFRLGVTTDWKSRWFEGRKEYADFIIEDWKIRDRLMTDLPHAAISRRVERTRDRLRVDVYTARPGIVIGAGAQRPTASAASSPRSRAATRSS